MKPNCYVDVILTVVCNNDPTIKNSFKFLADYRDHALYFPTEPISSKSNLSAKSLLYEYTGLNARIDGVGWVDLQQNLIIDSTEHLSICYFALIPEVVKLKKGQWYDLNELSQFCKSPEVEYILNNLGRSICV